MLPPTAATPPSKHESYHDDIDDAHISPKKRLRTGVMLVVAARAPPATSAAPPATMVTPDTGNRWVLYSIIHIYSLYLLGSYFYKVGMVISF